MSNKTYQVFERSLSYVAEPELVSSGLSFREARALAGSKMGDFLSHWVCQFNLSNEAHDNGSFTLEATKPIEGSSLSWGYRVTIEPEPVAI